jgi:hypothetical protein
VDLALDLSNAVASRLRRDGPHLTQAFNKPDQIRCCWVDDLLSEDVLSSVRSSLPAFDTMVRREGVKERKYVFSQVDRLGAMARSMVIALNQQAIADFVASLMGEPQLDVDPSFFNGGINVMMPGDHMYPHLDNSHNYSRTKRRVAALIYYLSDTWSGDYGGDLELCHRDGRSRRVEPRSNRLLILELTDNWHGIRPVVGPKPRITICALFYTPAHVVSPVRLTRYAPWPEQNNRLLKLYFDADFYFRSFVSKVVGHRRIVSNRHIYRPSPAPVGPEAGLIGLDR